MINKDLNQLLVNLNELHPWDNNPRRGAVDAIKASIERFGFLTPVVYKTDSQGFKTVYGDK